MPSVYEAKGNIKGPRITWRHLPRIIANDQLRLQIKQFLWTIHNFFRKTTILTTTIFQNDNNTVCLPLGGYDCLILDVYRARFACSCEFMSSVI